MDRLSPATRSRVMSMVRGKGTRLETLFVRQLRSAGISGFRRNVASLPGRPDVVFREVRLAVFVDSCFWHGCARHLRMPASRKTYWRPKIERNVMRDRTVGRQLRRAGWRVLRVWEHQIASTVGAARVLGKLCDLLKS